MNVKDKVQKAVDLAPLEGLEPALMQKAEEISVLMEEYLEMARELRGEGDDPLEIVFNHVLDFDTKICARVLSSRSGLVKHDAAIFLRLRSRY